MATTILTEAAFIALLPAGLLLYFILGRYTTPRSPETIFDEKTLLIAFVVGIPAGLPLAVIFLVFAGSMEHGDPTGLAYLLLFVAVANLGRMIFQSVKRFSDRDGSRVVSPFYTFAFGCGTAVSIMLGAADSGLSSGPSVDALVLLFLLSANLALLEGWAGIRSSSRSSQRLRLLTVSGGETLAMVAIAPLYFGGFAYLQLALLLALMVVLCYLHHQEDLRTLRPLLKVQKIACEPRAFGRLQS